VTPSLMLGEAYHVTLTKSVRQITKQGLRRFITSNWIKASGERYGNGEVFAFESLHDAIRWAGRMDWSFHHATGSGKVSIITINAPTHPWREDDADPLSHAGSQGRWLKSELPVPPEAITACRPVTVDMLRSVVRRTGSPR